MIKFFRKMRHQLLSENKIRNYLFYAIGEIVLVVIGILIALQINNWNNDRIKKIAEHKYYENLKGELAEDKLELNGVIKYNIDDIEKFKYGIQIIEINDRKSVDTLGHISMTLFRYSDAYVQNNLYNTILNSGEIKLVNNTKIIEGIRKLEETYLYINKMEDIHRDVILNNALISLKKNLKFTNSEIQHQDELFTFEFQNLMYVFVGIMDEKDEIYNRALVEIQAINELIDEELNYQNH